MTADMTMIIDGDSYRVPGQRGGSPFLSQHATGMTSHLVSTLLGRLVLMALQCTMAERNSNLAFGTANAVWPTERENKSLALQCSLADREKLTLYLALQSAVWPKEVALLQSNLAARLLCIMLALQLAVV